MSDLIQHECGIAHLRLRKPLQYYIDKYGGIAYGANKMYILMQKQINRGQDGVGIVNIKLNLEPGYRYISRYRTTEPDPIKKIFSKVAKGYTNLENSQTNEPKNSNWFKKNGSFTGESWLGHLRYGTHGKNKIENCHPFLRQNNWRSRNLVLAGNFTMTNLDSLFDKLLELGQHPKEKLDTVTVMEKIGHFLDEENQRIYNKYSHLSNAEITFKIEEELNLQSVLKKSCKDFDGGYTIAGIVGSGNSFVARDPSGIRPCFYYVDEEVIAVTSERPPLQVAFHCAFDQIKELKPAHCLIIDKQGDFQEVKYIDPKDKKSCSFERIYFSSAVDPQIYEERKKLGKRLSSLVLKAIDFDLDNTIFSYVPNSAEISYMGLIEAIEKNLLERRKKALENKPLLNDLLNTKIRTEKLIIKNAKLRTFIMGENQRNTSTLSAYDTTLDIVKKTDILVVMDDSIVRGNTLGRSILNLLEQLNPKKIIVVSSAPQIRYPDCYGIDMSRMKDFVAFRSLISLIKETGQQDKLEEVQEKCKVDSATDQSSVNYVKELYDLFAYEQLSERISQILKPQNMKADLQIIFQTIEDLKKAIPNHQGDWYFTGNYPSFGGSKVVNRAFVNYMEKNGDRAY